MGGHILHLQLLKLSDSTMSLAERKLQPRRTYRDPWGRTGESFFREAAWLKFTMRAALPLSRITSGGICGFGFPVDSHD